MNCRDNYDGQVSEQPARPVGRLLAIDEQAQSADSGLPAFLARPPGAPVYHGFPVLDGAEAGGFAWG